MLETSCINRIPRKANIKGMAEEAEEMHFIYMRATRLSFRLWAPGPSMGVVFQAV